MSSMGVGRAMQLAWLGEAHLREGRLDAARDLAQEANSLAVRSQERGHEAWSLHLLGAIVSRGDSAHRDEAAAYYRAALALAGELGMRPLAAHCHFDLGRLVGEAGHAGHAKEHLVIAARLYREMDMDVWRDNADAEMQRLA